MPENKSELEKAFELERLILFSDAVFAIAIILLIIEMKFPEIEKEATPSAILLAFKPTIIQFLAFCLSFIIIVSLTFYTTLSLLFSTGSMVPPIAFCLLPILVALRRKSIKRYKPLPVDKE